MQKSVNTEAQGLDNTSPHKCFDIISIGPCQQARPMPGVMSIECRARPVRISLKAEDADEPEHRRISAAPIAPRTPQVTPSVRSVARRPGQPFSTNGLGIRARRRRKKVL